MFTVLWLDFHQMDGAFKNSRFVTKIMSHLLQKQLLHGPKQQKYRLRFSKTCDKSDWKIVYRIVRCEVEINSERCVTIPKTSTVFE